MHQRWQPWLPGIWVPMRYVPEGCIRGYPIRHLRGLLADGRVVEMHYACGDGDGLMPPFEGWFEQVGEGPRRWFREVEPRAWMEMVNDLEEPNAARG